MLIGKMRHRVAVQAPARTPDGAGGYTEAFTSTSPSPVWAAVEPATPKTIERVVGDSVQGRITHLVTMRYHAAVTTKTRLVHRARNLDVRGVQNVDEMNQWLVLACEEVTA